MFSLLKSWLTRKNEVTFTSNLGPMAHEPAPAMKFIPEWFKNQKPYSGRESKTHVFNEDSIRPAYTPTVKRCIPFREMMTSGYIIPFPYDIAVKCIIDPDSGEEVIGIHTGVKELDGHEPIGFHARSQTSEHPYWKQGYSADKVYKFITPWVMKTPPGISCMFLHPQHQGIDKWEVQSGVVDTDVYQTNILFPAMLKCKPGDEFIIKGGSPMVQIIPFKREKWTHEVQHIMTPEQNIEFSKSDKLIEGTLSRNRYKTWFWHRKEYK